MPWRRVFALSLVLTGAAVLSATPAAAQPPAGQGENAEQYEKVMQAAVRKVSPSVVQIVTTGGADIITTGPKGVAFRKALGPTTGVIVSPDGLVISSAFNFINNPTTIVVNVPGHEKSYTGKKIATDNSRMLTLLQLLDTDGKPAKGLPVPEAVPEKELKVGQWALALGRTLDLKRTGPPSVSAGIISALGRVWGKAIQTDAKVSPVNYGGPMIDIQGRVQGVLVPANPRGDDATAGFEWYDSGIGFAVPMEHILKTLPRLKEGNDLNKGLLGIRAQGGDIYSAAPVVGQVVPKSSAAKAGLKPGDVILEIDGHPVSRYAQILHALGPRYEGDKISLKYRRGDKVIAVNDLALAGSLAIQVHPFLGILPMRDDPRAGVEVRYVYPKSPAEKAGLKTGDRIVKVGAGGAAPAAFKGRKHGRGELTDVLNGLLPGDELQLEVLRKGGGKTDTLKVTLAAMPGSQRDDELPDKLPEEATFKKALAPLENADPKAKGPKAKAPEKGETGFLERATARGRKYYLWVHEDYDPDVAHAVVVWMHPPGRNTKEDAAKFSDDWEDACKDTNIILIMPVTDNEAGWLPSDADFIRETVADVMAHYTVDRQRVVAHGMSVGGQLAIHLGFTARDLIRGVATVGAVVTQPVDNVSAQRLAFFLAVGDRDPLVRAVDGCKARLRQKGLPTTYREVPGRGREYLDDERLRELVRWVDSLDKL
jgi:serine protease Do